MNPYLKFGSNSDQHTRNQSGIGLPHSITWRRLGSALLVLLIMALLPPRAEAQVTPTTIKVLTNIPPAMLTAAATNITTFIPIVQGHNLTLQFRGAMTNAATDNQTFWLYPRVDGTNTGTHNPFIIQFAATGTTGVVYPTNIPWTALQGYTDLALTKGSNAAAVTFFLTNIVSGT